MLHVSPALMEQHKSWKDARDRIHAGTDGRLRVNKETRQAHAITRRFRLAHEISPFNSGFKQIRKEVCEKHGVTPEQMDGRSRRAKIVIARRELFYRCQKELGWSLPRIGRHCGGRDHTTILWSIRQYEAAQEGKRWTHYTSGDGKRVTVLIPQGELRP